MTLPDSKTLDTFLDIIENHVEPITKDYVSEGHRAFGASVIRKSDLSLVVASSNRFLDCPIYHGEVHTIKLFHDIPAEKRPEPSDCYFVSTHEPCFMCLAALTWAGFKEIFYVFSYTETSQLFKIPHDEIFLKEIFGVEDYRHENKFWSCRHLPSLINDMENQEKMNEKIDRLRQLYVAHADKHLEVYTQDKLLKS